MRPKYGVKIKNISALAGHDNGVYYYHFNDQIFWYRNPNFVNMCRCRIGGSGAPYFPSANDVHFWFSGSNWARIYNCALVEPDAHILSNCLAFPSAHQQHKKAALEACNLELRYGDVTNDFFLYSHLLEKSEHGGILVLPHDEANQKGRLKPALAECNGRWQASSKNIILMLAMFVS
ncbi:hypothetical protein K438DRAFT_1778204 [Mycena galopus ATCC 62051]|nr:hypothetical protein K438DRAFT_1778204 [Mycena galopus ATCC 62051]